MVGVEDATDDAALVERFRRGNMAAYERLFDRYSARIYSYAYRLTGNAAAAEDLTQEAFLRVFTEARKLSGEVNFCAWIYRLATNLCHDAFRKRTRRDHATAEYAVYRSLAENANTPEQQLLAQEQEARLVGALARLPVHYRTVLLLKYVEGMSYQQIGEVLSMSDAAVTSLLHRARTELRRLCRWVEKEGGLHGVS